MRLYLAIIAVLAVLAVGIISSGATQWYLQYPYFDKCLHLAGGFAIAWFLALVFADDIRRMPVRTALLFIIGTTVVVGLGWEVAEYLSNAFLADAAQGWQEVLWRYFHGGDTRDTLLDLGADALGGGVLAALFVPFARKRAPDTQSA